MNIKNDWSDLEFNVKYRKRDPIVRINSRCFMNFNRSFIYKLKKQDAGMTHVIYHFSKLNNAIVFTFTKDCFSPGAMKISGKKTLYSCAKSFLKYYSIDDPKFIGNYVAKLENIPNIGEAWVIFLNNKIKN